MGQAHFDPGNARIMGKLSGSARKDHSALSTLASLNFDRAPVKAVVLRPEHLQCSLLGAEALGQQRGRGNPRA
jgi:hypothetical protein